MHIDGSVNKKPTIIAELALASSIKMSCFLQNRAREELLPNDIGNWEVCFDFWIYKNFESCIPKFCLKIIESETWETQVILKVRSNR